MLGSGVGVLTRRETSNMTGKLAGGFGRELVRPRSVRPLVERSSRPVQVRFGKREREREREMSICPADGA